MKELPISVELIACGMYPFVSPVRPPLLAGHVPSPFSNPEQAPPAHSATTSANAEGRLAVGEVLKTIPGVPGNVAPPLLPGVVQLPAAFRYLVGSPPEAGTAPLTDAPNRGIVPPISLYCSGKKEGLAETPV